MPTTTSTTDIFIKTCHRDAEYLKHAKASIEKFCSGFRNTVIIEGEHPQGYLYQQAVKLHADTMTDADFILITDSDTLFTQPVTPESFMVDGKPIWIYTPWSPELRAAVPWFDCMHRFAGEEPHAEFMRRQPFMFPREVLPALREFCFHTHGRGITEYILSSSAFSEYNILGHFCWRFHREKFHWINTDTDELPPQLTRQFWSHDPVGKNLNEIGEILK